MACGSCPWGPWVRERELSHLRRGSSKCKTVLTAVLDTVMTQTSSSPFMRSGVYRFPRLPVTAYDPYMLVAAGTDAPLATAMAQCIAGGVPGYLIRQALTAGPAACTGARATWCCGGGPWRDMHDRATRAAYI